MEYFFALIWFSYKNQGNDEHRLDFVVKMFQKLHNSKFLRIIVIIVGIIIMLSTLIITFPIYGMDYSDAKVGITAVIVAIERTVISIGLSIFLLPSLVGKSGVLRVILGNRVFIPLARLNIAALLVHGVILMWYFFGKSQILRLVPTIMNFGFIALALLSYLVAVGFTLMFESPFITMENLLLCPKRKKKYNISENSQEDLRFSDERLSTTKRTGSFELKTEKLENGNKDKLEIKETMISNNEDRMRSDINYSIEASNIANSMTTDKPKKRNSASNSQENSKKSLRNSNLLNESEDSKHGDSFNEPLIG